MKRALIGIGLLALACQPGKPPPRAGEEPVRVVQSTHSLAPAASTETESDQPVAVPAGTFTFSDDLSGRILGRLLPPGEPEKLPAGPRTAPQPRRELPALERPEIAAAPPATSLPSLPPAKRPTPRPHGPPGAIPLIDLIAEITTPQRTELPESERIRTPSRDVNLPLELPTQARYSPDRAPLDDPTAELSIEKANSQPLPLRTTPAPFVRMNLPEPFENRAVLRSTVPEPPVAAPAPVPPK